MTRDFFDHTRTTKRDLVNSAILREAKRLIESCEHGNPESAEIPLITSWGYSAWGMSRELGQPFQNRYKLRQF
jgi:hypothetical protein